MEQLEHRPTVSHPIQNGLNLRHESRDNPTEALGIDHIPIIYNANLSSRINTNSLSNKSAQNVATLNHIQDFLTTTVCSLY